MSQPKRISEVVQAENFQVQDATSTMSLKYLNAAGFMWQHVFAVHSEGPQPRGQKCLFLRPQLKPARPGTGPRVAGARVVWQRPFFCLS